MSCYEYSKKIDHIGKWYIFISVVGIPLTLYFLSDLESPLAVVVNYILLMMFTALVLFGLVYVFLKGGWFYKIDDSHFEYVTPFGNSKCFRVPLEEIVKLEIQQSNSVDSVYYYLHLKSKQKYQLDTESLVSMSKIEKCLRKASVEVEYSTSN